MNLRQSGMTVGGFCYARCHSCSRCPGHRAMRPTPRRPKRYCSSQAATGIVDYAEDKCRLIRKFGTGETEVELHIEQYGPGPFYNLALFGKPARKSVGDVMEITFGPDEGPSERSYLGGKIKADGTPFIIMHGIHLAPVARRADQGEFEVTEIWTRPRESDLIANPIQGTVTTTSASDRIQWRHL